MDVNHAQRGKKTEFQIQIKPPSVTKNVGGLQIDDTGHVDRNSSADVARVVGLQTDAVVVTETRFRCHDSNKWFYFNIYRYQKKKSTHMHQNT